MGSDYIPDLMWNSILINNMKKLHFLIVLIISLFMSSKSLAQTKRALVIGLGEHEDSAWNKINGDKDVPYVLEFLNNANYEQIVTLVNEQATKDSIVAAFRNLEQSCMPNDIVYVHFSGHGQQMRDANNDESDELDECWIPYDAYRRPCEKDNGEKHLIDDEVNFFLNNIRDKVGNEGKILVVIDACHSGDATRFGRCEIIRGVDDVFETVKSYFIKPIDNGVMESPNIERWITLSACESDQINYEMKNPIAGKLTYAIYTEVIGGDLGDNWTFFKKLKMFMNINRGSRPQKPTMTGETTKYEIADMLK